MTYKRKKNLKTWGSALLLFFVALFFIYPFIWMFFSSFKDNREIYQAQALLSAKMNPQTYLHNQDLQKAKPQALPTGKASSFRAKRKLRLEKKLAGLKEQKASLDEIKKIEEQIQRLNIKVSRTQEMEVVQELPQRTYLEALNLAWKNTDLSYFEILIYSNRRNLDRLFQSILLLEKNGESPQKLKLLQESYQALEPYQYFDFRQVFFNSLIIALLHAIGVVLLSAAAAYVFAKFKFKGKKRLFTLAILVILIPKSTLILPLFEWISFLGLSGTKAGVILPGLLNAIALIFFTQIYRSVPNDLLDLYRLEGASELKTFFYSLPLISSALLSFGLIDFIMSWNEHLLPLIILQDTQDQTLPLALSQLMGASMGEPLAVIMAGSLFTLLPSLVLFAIMYSRIKSAMTDLILH